MWVTRKKGRVKYKEKGKSAKRGKSGGVLSKNRGKIPRKEEKSLRTFSKICGKFREFRQHGGNFSKIRGQFSANLGKQLKDIFLNSRTNSANLGKQFKDIFQNSWKISVNFGKCPK